MSLDATGQAVDLERPMARAETLVTAARAAADEAGRDRSLADAIRSSPGWQGADPALRRIVRHYVNSTVEQEYGSHWAEASAWHFDQTRDYGGGDVLFPDGFDAIPALLAQGLTLRLGKTVTALAPAATGVRISLAGGETVQADHAVVALPLGVLQSGRLNLAEPLSPDRQGAIDSLKMGLLNKCWLRFDRVRWPDDVDWIEWLGPRDGVWAQWVSLAPSLGAPLLLGFNAGSQAREVEALDDAGTTAEAHAALRAMFGSAFPAPLGAQVTRWSRDPLAGGSYSFNAVGTSAATRAALAGTDWDGRLVLAGEAAEPDRFGTAHGALLSGLAAAEMIGAAP
jgi:monoamine oxidase